MTSFEPRNVWRVAWIVVAALLLTRFGLWVLADGGSFVFTIIMSWLTSIAMEPAVLRLAHHMRRGVATMIVMGAVVLFALADQQIENLTIEPKISAKAVNVHPAVSCGSVLLGAALFGVAGALVAAPVAAMLLALFEVYSKRYEHVPELEPAVV
jgi:predicted PurR-regulated permease PerM